MVRRALEAEALTVCQAEASEEADAELGYMLSAKGRRALAQWRDAHTAHPPTWRPSDMAPRRVQSFSLLKS
jgi:hypothetical protein